MTSSLVSMDDVPGAAYGSAQVANSMAMAKPKPAGSNRRTTDCNISTNSILILAL